MNGDISSPAPSVAAVDAIYQEMKRRRDASNAARSVAKARGGTPDSEPVSRLRLAVDDDGKPTVDLSKADPGCARCGGTGRREDRRIRIAETGEEMLVPVICMCVHRRGGVAQDMLDRMLASQADLRR